MAIDGERQMNVPRHVPWQAAPPTSHNIWSYLLAFVWTWVLWDRWMYRVATDCAYIRCGWTCSTIYWEQSWYKLQASGPPIWCKPKDSYVNPTWQSLLSLTPPMSTEIITSGFASMGKSLLLVCARGHHHYGFTAFGPLHWWSDLRSRWHY